MAAADAMGDARDWKGSSIIVDIPGRRPIQSIWQFGLLLLVGCGGTTDLVRPPDSLPEWETKFTYRGEPIHPQVIWKFMGWISDAGPIVAAVDVAAAHGTNEYSSPVTHRDGWSEFYPGDIESADRDNPVEGRRESFSYRWLGRLSDGTHVVHTFETTTGTFTSDCLMFFKFSVDDGYVLPSSAVRSRRVVISVIGWDLLPGHERPEITLMKDHVVIGPDGDQKEPVKLFPAKK